MLASRRKELEALNKLVREAKESNKSLEEVKRIEDGALFDLRMSDELIALHQTEYWRQKAARLRVPLSMLNDEGIWEQCEIISDRRILTYHGIYKVRSALRKEQNERFELFYKYASLLIAIFGTLAALFSVI